MFYSSIGAGFLRIFRATSNFQDAASSMISLTRRMITQGADRRRLEGTLLKVIHRHREIFIKYGITDEEMVRKINNVWD